jgi:hypothetical protein
MLSGWCKRVAGSVAMLVVGLVAGGCCTHESKPYDVTVALSPAFGASKPAIEVHLVGVSDAEQSMWNTYSMSKYWQEPNNPLRANANKYVMNFGQGRPDAQVLRKADPIWEKWKAAGATRLFVLAFLPGRFEDAPADQDARRRVLPLDQCRWPQKDQQQIKVVLLPSNVSVETPPLAEKK